MNHDPYVDASTGVLVNLLGIGDADDLAVAEAEIVTARIRQLDDARLPGDYDVAHLQAFHRQLFGDIYPWAGDFRTVNVARTATFGDWRHTRSFSTRSSPTSPPRTT